MDSKGFTISAKNAAMWVTILLLIIAQITTYTLLKDQVKRNTAELEKYNLAIISTDLKYLTTEVEKMNEKTDQIFVLVTAYFKDVE